MNFGNVSDFRGIPTGPLMGPQQAKPSQAAEGAGQTSLPATGVEGKLSVKDRAKLYESQAPGASGKAVAGAAKELRDVGRTSANASSSKERVVFSKQTATPVASAPAANPAAAPPRAPPPPPSSKTEQTKVQEDLPPPPPPRDDHEIPQELGAAPPPPPREGETPSQGLKAAKRLPSSPPPPPPNTESVQILAKMPTQPASIAKTEGPKEKEEEVAPSSRKAELEPKPASNEEKEKAGVQSSGGLEEVLISSSPQVLANPRKAELKELISTFSSEIKELETTINSQGKNVDRKLLPQLAAKEKELQEASSALIDIAKGESKIQAPLLRPAAASTSVTKSAEPAKPQEAVARAQEKPDMEEVRTETKSATTQTGMKKVDLQAPPMTKKELMDKLNELRACDGKTGQLTYVKGLSAQQRQELIGFMSQDISHLSKQSGSAFKGVAERAQPQKQELQRLLHNLSLFSSSLDGTGKKRDVGAVEQELKELKSNGSLNGLDAISDDLASYKTTLADLEQRLSDQSLKGQDRDDALSKQTTLQNQVKTLSNFITFLKDNKDGVANLQITEKAALDSAKTTFLQNVKGGSAMINKFTNTADNIINGQAGDVKKQLMEAKDGIEKQGRSELEIYEKRSEYLLLAGLYGKYKVALEGLGNDPLIVSFSDLAKPGTLDMIKAVGGGIKKFTDSLIPGFIETVQDKIVKGPLLGNLGLNYPQGAVADLSAAQKEANFEIFRSKFTNLNDEQLTTLNNAFTALMEGYKGRGFGPSQDKYFANYDVIAKLITV